MESPVAGQTEQTWEQVPAPCPAARNGYNRAAVDEYVAERELAELRTRTPSGTELSAKIHRIGEETSAILIAAHDQAREIRRRGQAQADRCLADAATNAIAITENANRRLRELDSGTDSVWRERALLIEDIRNVGSALLSLAEDSAARVPGRAG